MLEFTPATVTLALLMCGWANLRQNMRLGMSRATMPSTIAASRASMRTIAMAMPTTLTRSARANARTANSAWLNSITSFWTRDMTLPVWLRS